MDRRHPFEAHARVDALLGERRETAALVHLVLHEDEVPVLHPAVAFAAGAAVGPTAADLLAHVVVELGARPAGTRRAGRPPEVVAPSKAHDVVVGKAVGLPDVDGLVVGRHLLVAAEHADLDAGPVDAELIGELQRPGDRFALEVVADREVAEHLEEGEVARRASHVLDVRGAKAALTGGQAAGRRRVDAQVVGLELLHAGGREQHARIAGRHERGRRRRQVAVRLEELTERAADRRRRQGRTVSSLGSCAPHQSGT